MKLECQNFWYKLLVLYIVSNVKNKIQTEWHLYKWYIKIKKVLKVLYIIPFNNLMLKMQGITTYRSRVVGSCPYKKCHRFFSDVLFIHFYLDSHSNYTLFTFQNDWKLHDFIVQWWKILIWFFYSDSDSNYTIV